MGRVTGKTKPCPSCRANGRDKSGDNLKLYTDGTGYCFACGHYEHAGGGAYTKQTEEEEQIVDIEFVKQLPTRALKARGISATVATRYGVRTEANPEDNSDVAYYFPVHTAAGLVGYQVKAARPPGSRQREDIKRLGSTRGALPFGSHVVGYGGMLIVVEGGEDCLAASQLVNLRGKNYRVVATLGVDGWKNNLEYFSKFDKVMIAYDQDVAGQEAANAFATALGERGAVMKWEGASDPNELLALADGADKFFDALSRAKSPLASSIITGERVWEQMRDYVEPNAVPFPPAWEVLQTRVGGIREGEITMFTAGSSVGKTAFTRKLKSHLLENTDWSLGEVELEEQSRKTWRGVMESVLGKPWAMATIEERRAGWAKTYGTNRLFTLDHRSQYGRGQSLVAKFKHLHYAHGCNVLFLDHVTLAVSEFGEGAGLQAQDRMMNEFLELVESTGVHLFLISHLRKAVSGGVSFEEGAVPSMDDLKGSSSLKQISFNIIGLSRNMRHPSEYHKNVSTLHALKVRENGNTGVCDRLHWNSETMILEPALPEDSEEDDEF